MRLALIALFLPSIASADPRALPELAQPTLAVSRSLDASEGAAQKRSYDTDINGCYTAVAPLVTGSSPPEIKLSIHCTGQLDAIDITTTGVPARAAKKLTTCVRSVVEGTAFPQRKAPTTAIVPYKWQRTVTPGGGPQLSCWDPKGCPTT